MSLTHAQARELIQFDADSALSADSLQVLKSHLASCEACRLYADSIHAMEVHLRRAMSQRWNLLPAPLSIYAIRKPITTQYNPLATRLAFVASAVVLFVAVILGITNGTQIDKTPQTPLIVPLIPTPSLQTTGTIANPSQVCDQIRYEVQPNDTLEGIAIQFSITADDLMDANNLRTEAVFPGTMIIIPVCNSTPTGTVHPPTFTTTITPLLDSLFHTPDG